MRTTETYGNPSYVQSNRTSALLWFRYLSVNHWTVSIAITTTHHNNFLRLICKPVRAENSVLWAILSYIGRKDSCFLLFSTLMHACCKSIGKLITTFPLRFYLCIHTYCCSYCKSTVQHIRRFFKKTWGKVIVLNVKLYYLYAELQMMLH